MGSWRRNEGGDWFLRWIGTFAFVIALVAAWIPIQEQTQWEFLPTAPRECLDLLSRMWPPDWSTFPALMGPLLDTIHIATLGTALAILMAFPLCWLAAENTSPSPFLRVCSLFIIAMSRSISSFIWAFLFVMIVGPGMLAGILAIAVRSVGFLAKLSYEAIEEIDPEPMEALQAVGATGLQVRIYSVLPQVLSTMFSLSIFRWDINVRESAVIGYVGGGGLGLLLNSAISALYWREACLILLLIFALVLTSEAVAARFRQWFDRSF